MKNITRVLFLLLCTFLFTTNINAQRSPSLGTIDYFSDALTNTIRTVRLSDDKILVTWLDNGSSSSNNLKAIVGTVSGTSVTFTPSDEVTITSNVFTTSHALVSFSSTKAAIVYEANLATDEMKYNVLDITGTTIVVGGQDDFGPSGGLQVGTTKASSAVAISDTQLVVTYEEDIGANDVFKVMAGTVSGTTITWGTAMSPNSDDGNNADVVRLTDSKFALAYEDQTTSTGVGKLRVGTVDGSNGITFGIEETFANSFDINIAKLAALSETEVVVVWEYITGTQYANARYATISGTGITFPTQTIPTFYTDEGVDDMAIAALSATEFIVAVDGGSGDDSEVYTGVVSSNNITMTSDGGSVIITGQADDIQIAPLTSDKAVVVYTNDQAVGTTTADRGDYVVASYTATTNPEINVQGNSVDIVSGDDTPSTGDHTDFGTGNPISRTFTIQNTGTGTLTLGSNAVTITGTNASEFTVTSQPATTVSSSSSTTFTVEFSSLVASTRTAQININSDDVHESNYFFDIEGVGAAAPSNNAPTGITLTPDTVGQSTTGVDAVVGALTSTDADGGDSHTYSLVSGTGDTDNGSFNIDGSNLRTDTALAPGSYSVRINTNDGTDDFADAISVTITDDVGPTTQTVAISDASMKVGDVISVTIGVLSDTDDYTTGSGGISGTIGGFTLGSFSRVSNSTYTASFTVTEGGTDVAAGSNIPVSVTLTDSSGNVGNNFTTAISQGSDPIDANTPSGYSVAIDQSPINAGNDDSVSFTFASAEVGTTYNYTFTSSGGAGSVANSGVIATATDQITGIDISGLPDGTITLSVTLTDTAGNVGTAATDTETKETVAPTGYSVTIDQSPINVGNDDAVSFTFAGAEVGATYNYTFTSSGGAGSVANSGVIATATDQITGIDISGLPDGTITLSVTLTDTNGNTGSAATDTETKDAAAPTGYSVTIDQSPINAGNDDAVSFTFAGAEVGATYNYTFTSSGGAGSVANSGVIATATDQITGIDISGLPDGTITLSVTLTDTNGNTGSAATDTETKETVAPTGYSVTIDQSPINAGNDDAVSFTFAGAEVGATYNYTFTSSGGAGSVANSGVIATATDQITGIDISGLPDGTITLSVTLTDTNGNTGSAATDTETKETVAPTGYSVTIDQSPINAGNDDAVSFTFAGAEVGATYNYTFTSSGGAGSVANSGVIATATDQITGIDISGLPDGTITLSVTLTDTNGNTGSAATDTETKETVAPTGYSVTIDQSPINAGNDDAVSFTFAGAEVGATYNYTFTSSGGAGSVANSGVIATATDQITGIDISGLPDGTITLSVTLTDTNGNTGSTATDTETKETVAPTGYSVTIDQSPINAGNDDAVSFTFAGAEVGATYNYTFTSSGGAGSVANSGVIATATDQITGIDISGLPDGTITLSVTLTDTNGNTGSAATDTETKETVAPTGYSVTIDQSPINAGNDDAVSFTFAGAEVGATYNYTFTSSGGAGSVSNSGVISTATDQITGIDISGLPDGTITLSVTLTDTNGNTGSAATDTETKDAAAPTGYSVTIDQSPINAGNDNSVSFTFAGAEVGAGYSYTFTSSGGAGSVADTGTISTATDQITGIDISGLPDGTITLSVTLTDTNGNTGSAATDTETKDAAAPTGYSVTIDQSPINAGNDDAVSFTFAGAEVGATYNYTFTSSGGAGSVSNSGVIATVTDQITGIDISGLPDGTITLSVTLSDTNGNTGSAATDTETKETVAPTGYSVTIDQSPIDAANEDSVSFTFAGAEVGATYNYTFTSSGGAGSVSNSGVIATATDQITGIDISGLPDGTITLSVTLTDTNGNTGSAATDTETKDSQPPSGYSVSIDQSPINAGNDDAVSFTFAGAEVGATYNYTFTSSGGAGSVANSGVIATATDQITGINISGLPDGTITLSVTLTDTGGNTGSAATDTETKETVAPTGYSVTIDQSPINAGNDDAVSFTFAGAEVGATYNYTFTSSGGAGSVANSGVISTATDQITGIDISGLPDGTITLSVTLTDINGNTGTAATDTETKETVAPTGYSVTIDQSPINAGNDDAVSFTFAGAEVGATYNYTFTSSGGAGSVANSGVIATATDQITGIDISGLPDGTITLSVTLTDTNGNTGSAATDTETKDAAAPTGYSVTIDQSPINAGNDDAVSFTFAGAEVGATYNYTFTSSGGAGSVSNSGVIATATDQITGIDISGLPDGTITLSVTLTDTNGNTGSAATDTETKETVPPSGYSVTIDQSPINAGNDDSVSFTFAGAEVGATYNYTFTSSGGAGSVSNSGVIATATDQISGIDISGLPDGTITLSVTLTDTNGNTGSAATDTETKETVAPTGYSVTIDQSPINAGNDDAVSFTFAGAEVGATYNYTFTSSGGAGSVSNSGVISTATDQITGIDLSGLPDGNITLSVTLTDTNGNTGTAATDTETKETVAPTGYSVSIDQSPINSGNQSAVSFTFAGAEVGATYNYTFTSSGGAGSVANSGVIATATDQITGIDISGLPDGTITLSVTLTDTNGNTGSAATDTETKDAVAPTGYSVTIDQSPINAGNDDAVSFTFSGAEVGATYNYTFTSSGGAGSVSNSGVIATATDQITGIDISGLPDGTITLSVTLTDTNGNTGSAATDTETKDATAPTGYSVSIDQSPINSSNANAVSFTFAGAEVGAGYSYTFTSSGGAGSVSDTGTISTATDQITGIDLSGLPDGTITLSVTLTDTNGNTGTAATDTETKSTEVSASVNDPSVAEGDSGSTTLTFTVSLSQAAPSGGASVDYAVTAGSASAGTDFTAIGTTTLNFTAGETSKTVDVTIAGDETVEIDETVTITLSGASGTNVVIGDAIGTGTITNDDQTTITVTDISLSENGSFIVTLTSSNAVDGGFSVDVNTADNTATSGDDYTPLVSDAQTFGGTAGEQETVEITVVDDSIVEADEIIDIALDNVVAGTVDASDIIITDTATATIENNDSATVTIANVSGNEDDGAITVTVAVDNAVDGGFTFRVNSADGTATTANSDYTPVSNELITFNGDAGEAETFTITPTADVTAEPDETVIVSMSTLTPGTVSTSDIDITDTGTVTILNDDNSLISVDDPTVSEGDAGSAILTYTVTLDQSSPGVITVNYATSDGTAADGTDYTAASGMLTFNPGETSKTVDVTVSGDEIVEVDETITFTLSGATGTSTIADATGTGTITNDDSATVTIADISEQENGTFTVTLTLDNAVDGGFDLGVSTSDVTATAGDDYTALTGEPVSFTGNVGETNTVTITVVDDNIVEADEIIGIGMGGLSVTTVNSGDINITDTATATIENNDQTTITIADISETESGTFTFTLTSSNEVDGAFSVDFNTADNTALAASDYSSISSSTINFNGDPGEQETVTVTVSDDAIVEADETFTVNMDNPIAVTIDPNDIVITDTATATIQDNDSATLSINDVTLAENNDGSTTDFVFTVTLTGDVSTGFTVDYATGDNTTTVGDDYTAVTGQLNFAGSNGETQTITVTVNNDEIVEADETFGVMISNVQAGGLNVTIADDTGVGTITNDDSTTVTVDDISEQEDGTFTLTLTSTKAVDGGFSVDINTADNTAIAGDDYNPIASQSVLFDGHANETKNVVITVIDDAIVEADEIIDITLDNVVPVTASASAIDVTDTATATIENNDTATVTIADVSQNEDNGAIQVTAIVDNAVDGGFTVNVNTADGTATLANSDYSPVTSQTLNFSGSAGEMVTFDVTPTADVTVEPDETVSISMDSKTAGTVSTNSIDITDTATVTILNDDNALISIDDPTVAEGDDGTATLSFAVSLDQPAATTITVDFVSSNGTASDFDNDFIVSTGTVTFNAGETSQTIDITVNGDTKVELDENLTVSLSNAVGTAIIDDSTGTGTITNDDSATLTIADISGGEDNGLITVSVTLDNAVDGGFDVFASTADGTATLADSDYLIVNEQLSFSGDAGETQVFQISPQADSKVEANETISISLNNPMAMTVSTSNLDITDTATVTINNDDSTTVTVEDVSVNEDTGIASLTLTLNGDVDGGFDVNVSTADGTATTADSDYVPLSGATETFTGTSGETIVVDVVIGVDTKVEADETFTVSMSGVAAGTVSNTDIDVTDGATVTILNDDNATLSIDDVTLAENAGGTTTDFTFTVTLTGDVDSGFMVDYLASDGTATLGSGDFNTASGSLAFVGDNNEAHTFTVTVNNDDIVEVDETFSVTLSNIQAGGLNVTFADATGTGTITNDDSATLTIADVNGDEDSGPITVEVTLDNAVDGGFTIDLNTADGTATLADSDYLPVTSEQLTFTGSAGEIQTFTISPEVDAKVEADETVSISMSGLSPNTVSSSDITFTDTATATINNDDSTTVTVEDVSVNEDTGIASLTLTLNGDVDGGFDVNVSTADGTATTADSDYVPLSGATETFTGTSGETIVVDVVIGVDTKVEADETFTVSMSGVAAGTVSNTDIDVTDDATVTILNDDTAAVTIADVTVNEADGTASFTATLDTDVDGGFTVEVSSADGTATLADSDYLPLSEVLSFSGIAGETQTFTVTITDDSKVEVDETATISMSNLVPGSAMASSITITDTATVTINNDDDAAVTIADVSQNEDDGPVTVTLTLDNAIDGGFTINANTSDGPATTADLDYSPVTSETLTFAGLAGETQTFEIAIGADNKVEIDEFLIVFTDALVPATVAASDIDFSDFAEITILNDDSAAVTIEDVSGLEDGGAIIVTATLDNPVDGGFTIQVSTADDIATLADSDYSPVSGEILTFTGAAGETQTFEVIPTVDSKVETDERLFVGMSNLGATPHTIAINDGAAVFINNDDNAAVTIEDITVNEADGSATVTLTLDNAVQGGFTVELSSADGTAEVSDNDYVGQTGTPVAFAGTSGETQTVTFTITDDNKVEADETFTVAMSNVAATTLAAQIDVTDGAAVTITNDDAASVTIEDVSGNEDDGDLTFTATLDNPVQGGFTVEVSSADGTAEISDNDYSVVGTTLTFVGTQGETQTFTLSPTVDNKVEENETVIINQGNLGATSLTVDITDTATATINNEDTTEVTIDLDAVDVDEDAGFALLTATLSNPVQGDFFINITTTDGTAIAPGDYTASNDDPNIDFGGFAGEQQIVFVPIIDDTQGELSETFTVTLTSVSGTTLGAFITTTDSAVVTIIDNDAPVVSSVAVPADGLYGIGDNLDFTVTFTDFVTTTGTPQIPITIGSATVNAELSTPVSNSLTAVFTYTIVEGDLDIDGIEVGTDINLNGGTIIGTNSTIDAILTLNGVASTANVNVDGIRPIPFIDSAVPDPTNAEFVMDIVFDEPVTGFTLAGIDVVNGNATNLIPDSATEYRVTITPTTDGTVTVTILANAAFDSAGNGNVPSNVFSVEYDATRPTPVITSTTPDPTNTGFDIDITFDEPVTGLTLAGIDVGNGAPSGLTGSGTDYTVTITPAADGVVNIIVLADSAFDAAGNGNVPSNEFSVVYDTTPPDPPAITHISDYTCSGNVMTTGDSTLEISGTAERESTIEVFIDGISIGTTVTDADTGFWTFDYTGTTLADGTYTFTALSTDTAVNTGNLSAPFEITINTVDSDGDGNPDFCDDDDNGNGAVDVEEDCDGDGIVDSEDTDNSTCREPITQTARYGFSPNGDGVNDGWVIEGITAFPNNVVEVYNRSGKLVFKQNSYQNDWQAISNQLNGNTLGRRLPVGPYIFLIDLGDGSAPTRGWLYINY